MQLPPRINRLVGQAMHDYAMLADGDQVLVAVSGGVDSLVLARLLSFWQKKAPISYHLHFVHVCMAGAGKNPEATGKTLGKELARHGLALHLVRGERPGFSGDMNGKEAEATCFACARARRALLFEEARRLGCTKLALGHHKDDLIETFLLNLTCAGNISTMRPRQELFSGRLALIRPLAYVEKKDIAMLAETNDLRPLPATCPLAGHTRREIMHELAEEISRRIPGAKRHIFAALGNVRHDYLLEVPEGMNGVQQYVNRTSLTGS